jgi:hypothetical protein
MERGMPYGAVVAELLKARRVNPLGPGTPNEETRVRLEALRPEDVVAPRPVRDRDMAAACVAGLWLYYNFLDESHRISQELDTTTGSYWHGLMHRREPDFGNSAYWFRRVGRHPVFGPLRDAAAEVAGGTELEPAARFLAEQREWDPFAFIDLCSRVQAGRSRSEALCREVQQREWELLFDYCFRAAAGDA